MTAAAPAPVVPVLEVIDLAVRFGGVHVLDGVDLRVGPGFTGLIGPNGAGKTTLFNVVSGYVRPARGAVRVAGLEITGRRRTAIARLGVGRSFQTPKLIGELSVLDNVVLGLDGHIGAAGQVLGLLGIPAYATGGRKRADELIDRFGLTRWRGTPAASLPLASQKTVEVARALAAGPRLLLLDEPAAGLAGADVERLVDPLAEIAAESGMAVVIIEHDLELVARLCPEVAVLHFGRIITAGSPATVMSHPDVVEAYLGAGVAAGTA